jgi:N-methylhydantoinase A
MFKIGIDVGGTFTDFVVLRPNEAPRYFKTHSTPQDPSEGVLTGLREVAAAYSLTPAALLATTELLIHGTTVATNTLIERKGARVGLLTTAGFRDFEMARMKEDRYNCV